MSSVLPSPDLLVDDPAYLPLKEYLLGSTGLEYYADKDTELARRLRRRLEMTGAKDCASYFDLLRDPLRGSTELDALVAEITIGETYFFRHAEHFEALRQQVVPDLIARNRITKSLRIWCAGCADGPEVYSLAILLTLWFGRELEGWNVSILGTDINRHALARAREGKFEDWALRSISDEERRKYCLRQGASWIVAPEYRERVHFQYHNLVEDPFPSLIHNLSSFDLIVCRNVMIYFGSSVMQKVVGQFYQCLTPGGWLLVGPSEPNMTCFTSFQVWNAPGTTLYRRPESPVSAPYRGEATAPELPLPPAMARAVEPASLHVSIAKQKDANLADMRAFADTGAWQEAARCCDELLAKDNLNPTLHFYRGLILEHLNHHAEAEENLKRAIYLDRGSVLAHYYFGLLHQSRGDTRQAIRSFQNVLDLLRKQSDDECFPDADDITVHELRKLTNMHLDMLRERP